MLDVVVTKFGGGEKREGDGKGKNKAGGDSENNQMGSSRSPQ